MLKIKLGVCALCGKAHDLEVKETDREAQFLDVLGGASATQIGSAECPTTGDMLYVYVTGV